MIDKRTFFKQILGAALVTFVPFTPTPIIPLSIKAVDVHRLLTAQMSAQIQAEIDRDMISRMIRIAGEGQWAPSEINL